MIKTLIHFAPIIIIGLECILFVTILLKKNSIKLIDTAFEQLLIRLPVMIRSVEEKGLTGPEKKLAVLSYAFTWLADLTGLSCSEVRDTYGERIDESIESILSTPEKKEVINEKDYEKAS